MYSILCTETRPLSSAKATAGVYAHENSNDRKIESTRLLFYTCTRRILNSYVGVQNLIEHHDSIFEKR